MTYRFLARHEGQVKARKFPVISAILIAVLSFESPATEAVSLDELVKSYRRGSTEVFGSFEFPSESFPGLPQWHRVLTVFRKEQRAFSSCVTNPDDCATKPLRAWAHIIRQASELSGLELVRTVNNYVNQWPYRKDLEVFNRREYWATPMEFFSNSGDCEDFAITKYFALRALGVPSHRMRVVAVVDDIRGVNHAVLTIKIEGAVLVLDSLANLIREDRWYGHYQPVFSVNETIRWAHIPSERKLSKNSEGMIST